MSSRHEAHILQVHLRTSLCYPNERTKSRLLVRSYTRIRIFAHTACKTFSTYFSPLPHTTCTFYADTQGSSNKHEQQTNPRMAYGCGINARSKFSRCSRSIDAWLQQMGLTDDIPNVRLTWRYKRDSNALKTGDGLPRWNRVSVERPVETSDIQGVRVKLLSPVVRHFRWCNWKMFQTRFFWHTVAPHVPMNFKNCFLREKVKIATCFWCLRVVDSVTLKWPWTMTQSAALYVWK